MNGSLLSTTWGWPSQGTIISGLHKEHLLKEQFEETDYQRQSQDKDVITQGGVEQNCLM